MLLNNPFETFEKTAFRLEALPQYLVENERLAFDTFKASGKLPDFLNSDWADLVEKNTKAGKTMQRLRLLSDELSEYEKFETQVYPGLSAGEVIRVNLRSKYIEEYKYDFWLFDDRWIAEVMYESDGTFIRFDLREATATELEYARYWQEVFAHSQSLHSFLLS